MEILDADKEPLYSNTLGKGASRDLVQFVSFQDFAKDSSQLAKEVLKEIPSQMCSYFQSKKISPNPGSQQQRLAAQLAQTGQSTETDNYFLTQKQNFIDQSTA